MTTITKFKLFWAWEDDKEENWLREMSQQGYHLSSLGLPGFYKFEQGFAKDYVYRLDYIRDRKDYANYLQLFNDSGWDHMGEMAGWQYFRKEAVNGDDLEIYSDNESKANKYQRVVLLLVIILPLLINMITVPFRSSGIPDVLRFIFFGFFFLYIYGLTKLLMRIRNLKKKI
jgi:hypothetical protein